MQAALENVRVFYKEQSSLLYVNNVPSAIQAMALYDLSGKLIVRFRESELTQPESGIQVPQLAKGMYLLYITIDGISKAIKLAVI